MTSRRPTYIESTSPVNPNMKSAVEQPNFSKAKPAIKQPNGAKPTKAVLNKPITRPLLPSSDID